MNQLGSSFLAVGKPIRGSRLSSVRTFWSIGHGSRSSTAKSLGPADCSPSGESERSVEALRFRTYAFVALVTMLIGCRQADSVALEGRVTLDLAPVTRGTVIFTSADGRTASANLTPDGRYRLPESPVGVVRVAVQVPDGGGNSQQSTDMILASAARDKAAAGEPLRKEDTVPDPPAEVRSSKMVPARYASIETSGLQFEITSNQTSLDISLKSS